MLEAKELCQMLFDKLEKGQWAKIEPDQPLEYYRNIDLLLRTKIAISYREYITINPDNADYVEFELKM